MEHTYTSFDSTVISGGQRYPVVGIGAIDLEVYATSPSNWAIDRKTKTRRPDTVFLCLKNVLHVPSSNVNVFSAHAIDQSGYDVILNSPEGGGYLQEYHDFMLEHKSYACISMNRKHYVLKVITEEQILRAQHGLTDSARPVPPIPGDALLSFDWPDREEQRW